MRTPKPPAYLRHSSGQARTIIRVPGRKPETRYLGVYGTPESREAHERAVADWQRLLGSAALPEPSRADRMTIVELVARWNVHAEGHYRGPDGPTTELRAFQDSLAPLLRLHGRTLVRDFGPLALKRVRDAMVSGSWLTAAERASRKRGALTWCRRLVNQRVNRIRRVFKWAASEELIPATVYEALRSVQGLIAGRTRAPDHPEVGPVSDDVVQAVLPHLHPVPRALVEFIRLTGCRPGEGCIIRPCDVDRTGVKVGDIPVWIYRPHRHKSSWRGHNRLIAIGPRAQAVLLPYLLRPADAYCFSPREADPRFRGRRTPGLRYCVLALGRAVRRVCARHGLPGFHLHQLRHSMASSIHSIDDARAVLGHKEVRVTAIYQRKDVEAAARVIADIG